jgi:type 1 glutamine amidotransferase
MLASGASAAGPAKIAFVAGPKSHGYGQHAHNSGCLLLAKCLNDHLPGVDAVVHQDGWPADPSFFDGASAIVLFADGGAKNPILGHFEEVDRLVKQGVGLAVLHYALIVEKGEEGNYFQDWIGGYYETHWSVNPMWTAAFKQLPRHPITRGVKPFAIRDEWYYHMRFRPEMEDVTPILTAVPPDATRERKFGPHSGNPVVASRKGMPEHVAWAYEPATGGRGFGFTGGHYHWAWGDDNYRTLMLNGIAWAAGIDIPAGGVPSPALSWEDLLANEEGERPEGFSEQNARALLYPPE